MLLGKNMGQKGSPVEQSTFNMDRVHACARYRHPLAKIGRKQATSMLHALCVCRSVQVHHQGSLMEMMQDEMRDVSLCGQSCIGIYNISLCGQSCRNDRGKGRGAGGALT